MEQESKTDFNQLFVGFEFPKQSYTFDASMAATYIEAVKESNDLYLKEGLVPPMEVTAYAMASLSRSIALPAGTIHVTQELDFMALVKVGDTITCSSKVSRKVDRSGMHIMTTDIEVINQNQVKVLAGKVGFILPEPGGGKAENG
jgi:acyl dehydratase